MSASFARAAVDGWLGRVDRPPVQDAEGLLAWGRANRVVPQILAFLDPALREREQRAFETVRRHRADIMHGIAAACRGDPAVFFAKGFSVDRFYPTHAPRQFADIDVQIREIEQFWPIHDRFAALGLRLSAFALRCPADGRSCSAAARYELPKRSGARRAESIDVDVGPLWLGGRAHVVLPDAYWADREAGPHGTLVGRRAGLVRLAAEVAERKRIILRDALDLAALWDGSPLLACAGEARAPRRLLAALRVLATAALRLDRIMPFLEDGKLAQLRSFAGAARTAPPFVGSRIRDEFSEVIQGFSLRGSFLVAMRGRVGRSVERVLDPRARMRRGDWIQLHPFSPVPRGDLAWLSRGDGTLLRTPIGCFAPALFGIVDGERLAGLVELCEDAAEHGHAPRS